MFYLVHAGPSLQVVTSAGTIFSTLTLPAGVTLSSTRPAQFAVLASRVIITNAPSVNLWLDPITFTLHILGIVAPTPAPTVAAGAGAGLTGDYSVRVTFLHKSGTGEVLNESPLSVRSNTVTLTNQSLAGSAVPVSTDPSVNARRVYRTASGGTVYFFAFDIPNNTATTFDDSTPDDSLDRDIAPDTLGTAPAGTIPGTYLTLIVEWKSRLWARAEGEGLVDHIYYTEVGFPWAWNPENDLPAYSLGEDETGITGFIRRRDELGVGKRNRVMRVTGSSNDDFQVIIVSEETGIIAPASVVVIRDEGYFLGIDGVYKFGPDGVSRLSNTRVDGWFNTREFFQPTRFTTAFAGFNQLINTYDLHLAAIGSSAFDRWVSLDLDQNEWTGPHRTAAFTPKSRTMFRDANAAFLPVIGGTDGFLYLLNRTRAADVPGPAPSVPLGIAIDWITNHMQADDPDLTHVWGMPTIQQKSQGAEAGDVLITPQLGSLDAPDGDPTRLSLREPRVRLPRWGTGNLLRLQFTHDTVDENVEIYLLEQPFVTLGRR